MKCSHAAHVRVLPKLPTVIKEERGSAYSAFLKLSSFHVFKITLISLYTDKLRGVTSEVHSLLDKFIERPGESQVK